MTYSRCGRPPAALIKEFRPGRLAVVLIREAIGY
jgi:hypothetical protein